ncbi:MAG: hypothetical protein QNJ19_06730 [Woeseiaceae bacterium]|nr:hypothetical protein [Woeseiaceae bacterium]
MNTCRQPKAKVLVSLISLLLIVPVLYANDEGRTTPAPGFRPDNENATAFIEALDSATIAVFPTMVRRENRTAHSFSSQRLAVSMLNDSGLVKATLANKRIDLGSLHYDSQWNLFQYGLNTVSQSLTGYNTGADYSLVIEILVRDNQSVFGIACYIIDREGRDTFSFLLNSHHQMFAEAELQAKNSSEDAREAVLRAATEVAITALERQIEKAARKDTAAVRPTMGNGDATTDLPTARRHL